MARQPLALVLSVLLHVSPGTALALRCDTNPGGPEEIQLILESAGSDIDVG